MSAAEAIRDRALEVERELREAGEPLLIPGPRVCEILHVGQRTLSRLVAQGDLSTNRTSKAGAARVLIRRAELARYLAAREHREAPARA